MTEKAQGSDLTLSSPRLISTKTRQGARAVILPGVTTGRVLSALTQFLITKPQS